ncbi:pantoate--beta-alanine ligase [bacterium endosymbiont of Escarpia laminata]|nr:MAG: pantoate--beta-alanine ligase [bacterium endosymbiont of Escarpia laminata]RLJ21860.1 MAG: pantoate--beta-alanine ligase [bacterium endosymbiont of Escarpia laminata]
MKSVSTIDSLRRQVSAWRSGNERIAFVPTMGNLHVGHLELVRRAREQADRCVVSVFVNPMQFGEGEDFGSYPRTLEADREKLSGVDADLLFTPPVEVVYPSGKTEQTRVEVPGLSDILCGSSRPGHFVGVATVVCKLFNMVQPDLALFGEKDFQQLMVLRRMAAELCFPLEVIGVPTVREKDGLALSSRNGYLTPQERSQAPALHETLKLTAKALMSGERDYDLLEFRAQKRLVAAGFRPDYFTVRRAADLGLPAAGDRNLVILAAAYLGKARLIDNMTAFLPLMEA